MRTLRLIATMIVPVALLGCDSMQRASVVVEPSVAAVSDWGVPASSLKHVSNGVCATAGDAAITDTKRTKPARVPNRVFTVVGPNIGPKMGCLEPNTNRLINYAVKNGS